MVERLITAYRAKIYDMTFSDYRKLIKQNKKFFLLFTALMLSIIVVCVVGILCKKFFMVIAAVIATIITIIWADRTVVRQHRKAIVNRMDHLKEFSDFLKDAIPNNNLHDAEHIKELVSRLSVYTDEMYPFRKITNKAKQFATAIVVPVVAYLAGAYTPLVLEQELNTVLTLGVGIIILLALAWIWGGMIMDILRPLFCRDYDAAVSMREDLLDLQLLYFSGK